MKHLLSAFLFVAIISLTNAQSIAPQGGGALPALPHDEISQEQYAAMRSDVQHNIEVLSAQGKLVPAQQKTEALALEFPLAWNAGFSGYNFYGISNFADHNTAFPGALLDWNCGARTYDTDAGYNHQGIDYFLWPFSWKMMQEEQVQIVAAAPGMIVARYDGNFDQNCAFNPGSWNAVFVRHDDGSTAWYGHMKNGSVTAKGLGDFVETGEYLGLVGSSGNSTGPHLHFELYDADGALMDPNSGACNEWNDESWWADQKPYIDPEINKLQTHFAPPTFPPCPEVEITNESNTFNVGDVCYFALYAKDLSSTDLCHLKITRADGSVWYEWDFYQPADYFSASYWYWFYTIPEDVPEGVWTWSAELAGKYYEHQFIVGDMPVDVHENGSYTSVNAYFQNNSLQLQLSSSIEQQSQIAIIDAMGRMVAEKSTILQMGDNLITMPCETLSSGIYFIRILNSTTGATTTIPVSKQF